MTAEHLSSLLKSMGPALANHLWQSTVFGAVVGLFTLWLRKHQARIRFSLWLAASIKFLVPFSLLIAFGGLLPKPQHAAAHSQTPLYAAIDVAGQPFSGSTVLPISSASDAGSLLQHLTATLPYALAGIWLFGALVVLLVWVARWRQASAILHRASPTQHGREINLLRRLEETTGRRERIALRLSPELVEPEIFGIFRPVLIWPERLSERLEDDQMEAILAHEITHQRRHDNLTAAMHMLVEVLFWFHPMVWWMERRLVEERERACDEAVVRLGGRPEAYAEALLKACRFCVESPLVCASGITGADLSRRVRSIMTLRVVRQLGLKGKLLLAVAAGVTIAGPVTFGVVSAAPTVTEWHAVAGYSASSPAPAYDVASIKPNKSGWWSFSTDVRKDSYSATNISLKALLVRAYGINGEFLISGGPKWLDYERFDINAKATDLDARALDSLTREQRQIMLQQLIVSRFHLQFHTETKILPVYNMVLTKGGPKFKAVTPEGGKIKLNGVSSGGMSIQNSQLTAHDVPLSTLANSLSYQLHRTVLDKAGLAGKYDFSLTWIPNESPDNSAESSIASIFTALQEQLGLKLQSAKGPVEALVIDHVEKPSDN